MAREDPDLGELENAVPGAARISLTGALVATASEFHRRGWCLGTSGSFSAALAADPLELLISTSGLDKGTLGENDFVHVGSDAAPRAGETCPSPVETKLHLAVYRSRNAASVLHTHSVAGTLLGERFADAGGFAVSGYEMLNGLARRSALESEEFVPVLANMRDPKALVDRVTQALDEHAHCHGFLLAGGGLYTWGDDLMQARRHVEIFEFLFELLVRRAHLIPFRG